jgi:hypothetical protein
MRVTWLAGAYLKAQMKKASLPNMPIIPNIHKIVGGKIFPHSLRTAILISDKIKLVEKAIVKISKIGIAVIYVDIKGNSDHIAIAVNPSRV